MAKSLEEYPTREEIRNLMKTASPPEIQMPKIKVSDRKLIQGNARGKFAEFDAEEVSDEVSRRIKVQLSM